MTRFSASGEGTLAAAIRAELGGVPWSKARALVTTGKVRVDGVRVLDPAVRPAAGAEVVIDVRAPVVRSGVLADDAIVFVDRHVVVVDKPAGLLSVPYEDGDRDTLVDLLRAALRRRAAGAAHRDHGARAAFDPQLGVVHRLDKDTSGLLVFARTLEAKRRLAEQFRVHSVERRYVALAHGAVEGGTVVSELLSDRGDGLRGSKGWFRAPRQSEKGQRAVTHLERLALLDGASLVACRLETGRQHQIRIHLAERGHPLVGERVYVRDYQAPRIDALRPMLHAANLGFAHPASGAIQRFEAPWPADFAEQAARLGLRR